MSNVFLIADTHFGHYNIIKYCGRPFKNVTEMDEYMIEQWNKVVKPEDKVFHLGDFAFANQEYILEVRKKLNGKISLIKGNHDKHNNRWYSDLGFEEVSQYPIIWNDYFVLSHKPPEFVPENSPLGYFYGHVHNSHMYPDVTDNTACVSVERLGYTPIEFSELKSKMEKSMI